MGPVTNFLLRWLYIQSLIDDKSLITNPSAYPHPQPPPPPSEPYHSEFGQYKVNCKQALLVYRPGYDRLFALDSERLNCLNNLINKLLEAETILRRRNVQRKQASEESRRNSVDLDADLEAISSWLNVTGSHPGSEAFQNAQLNDNMVRPLDFSTIDGAHTVLSEAREYLPQLVSVLLHSTSALTPSTDPINEFRNMIVRSCKEDPSLGIELCWLLEAEVGRAWKTLFEHKDRTGRRLIVVLPHDKARVMAKIGTEKRYAFDLLQDCEMATAFGFDPTYDRDDSDRAYTKPASRLPSSISELRCNYFGDAMHFVDRLTQVSLDLRMVPMLQRKAYMQDSLREINRRVHRRMFTKGKRSLDEDDGLGPNGFPQLSDINLDMTHFSVHLPLLPKREVWEGGKATNESTSKSVGGVVRILNIVTDECRLLASRDRCPFLVLLEVADTEMEGNDARLFSGGGTKGLTMSESIGLNVDYSLSQTQFHQGEKVFPYSLPGELLSKEIYNTLSYEGIITSNDVHVLRGGWQQGDGYYYSGPGYNPEYEFLYNNNPYGMQSPPHSTGQPNEHQNIGQTTLQTPAEARMQLTGVALLDHIYGKDWSSKCEEIRLKSRFADVKGWRLAAFIMKAGEDIRKESLVMQIICSLNNWFKTELPISLRPILRPYTIMCVGEEAGLVECLCNAKSVDEIKKECPGYTSLKDYFERAYNCPIANFAEGREHQYYHGIPSSSQVSGTNTTLEKAKENFLRSLVGYSLVSYILQIKDRHNANILLDRDGVVMHIDFGFVLGQTPKMGKVPIFNERAPFKLTEEFWEVIGGWNTKEGGKGAKFCAMFEAAFACASKHSEEIAAVVEATYINLARSRAEARYIGDGIRERLRMRGPPGSPIQKEFIMDLVNTALTSWGTSTYDWLQKTMNGYEN